MSRSPAFAALAGARAVSLLGDGIGSLALIAHVQDQQGTGTAMGLLLVAASLPRLLSPVAGTVADRVDQRLVLAGGELGQGVLLVIAAVWLPPLPVLLFLLLAKATIVTVSEPAGTSAVPALVDDEDLVAANAVLGVLRQAGEVLGPVLGGLVVYFGGIRAGLAVDALTFLVSVPLLARVPRLPPAPRETVIGIWADARAGVRYILRAPAIRGLTIGFFLVGLSAGDDVALPFLAPVLGAGVRGTGALFAAVGAGLILGYLLLGRRSGSAWATNGLLIGGTLAALGNTLTGLAPLIVAAVAFQMVRGVGLAVYETALQTALQRTVPREMLGRVSSNAYGAVNLGACLGLVIAGPVLDATSARAVLVACGVIGLVGAVVSARPGRMASV
ncbi:MAG TPA: MFS transporter [Acidimicrobiales bacterium]|nr:MFS transporter [Acidimicrobiales bacterium]